MFYKSAYHHAQHITISNRCRTYNHFSGASQTPCRRVNAQIASYFQEIISLPRKRSYPSITYLQCDVSTIEHINVRLTEWRAVKTR